MMISEQRFEERMQSGSMEVCEGMDIREKLRILADAAKYDVACTSSGSDRKAQQGTLGSACAAGICHSFAADGRCISLLKILMTNECVFDCKYCSNRRSNDVERARFTPEEICTLTMEFYRRNYIEGLFLSSGVYQSPDRTMELLYETIYLLRKKYRFMGYIHVKGIPGADPVLIEKTGFLVDRMSVNLELPTSEGLKKLAPSKREENLLGPMKHIQSGIHGNPSHGLSAYQTTRKKLGETEDVNYLWENAVPKAELEAAATFGKPVLKKNADASERILWLPDRTHAEDRNWLANGKLSNFVPAGQSTQMIIGAAGETDYQIMMKAEMLYQDYDLKRVFYSAFINTTHDSVLPETPDGPPLLREHRLYQTDFLMRYYGFQAREILTAEKPDLNLLIDPKCNWAVRHLEHFPVEVSKADYGTLLRVPGIGPKSAERIVNARRNGRLTFDALKRMGVVLKRAHYFILVNGQQLYRTKIDEGFITNELTALDKEKNWREFRSGRYMQLSLFSDFGLNGYPGRIMDYKESGR